MELIQLNNFLNSLSWDLRIEADKRAYTFLKNERYEIITLKDNIIYFTYPKEGKAQEFGGTINVLKDSFLETTCSCGQNNPICIHAASIFAFFCKGMKEIIKYNRKHTHESWPEYRDDEIEIRKEEISHLMLIKITSPDAFNKLTYSHQNYKFKILDKNFFFDFYSNGSRQQLEFIDKSDKVHITCTCNNKPKNGACIHTCKLLYLIAFDHGSKIVFLNIENITSSYKQALNYYNLTEADVNKKIVFQLENNDLKFEIIDPKLKNFLKPSQLFQKNKAYWSNLPISDYSLDSLRRETKINAELETCFCITRKEYFFEIMPFAAKISKGKVSKITDYSEAVVGGALSEPDEKLTALIKKTKLFKINEYKKLKKKIASDATLDQFQVDYILCEKILSELHVILKDLSTFPVFLHIGYSDKISSNTLEQVDISPEPFTIELDATGKQSVIELDLFFCLSTGRICEEKIENEDSHYGPKYPQPFYINYKDCLYFFPNFRTCEFLRANDFEFPMKVKEDFLPELLENYLTPLSKNFNINYLNMPKIKKSKLKDFSVKIFLSEVDRFLLFRPVVDYQIKEVFLLENEQIVEKQEKGLMIYERNVEREKEVTEILRDLHADFKKQLSKDYLYLPFEKVFEGDWFFKVFESFKANKFEVFGLENIKKLKYNPYRPTVRTKASSGQDWFDLKVEIGFGNQMVSLKDVRKAILKKENFVKLGDGSLGLLPEDWLKKYREIFKFGELNDDSLRISKRHFTIIDALHDEINEAEILFELQEKKKKLLGFSGINEVSLPKDVNAELRPYQKQSYQWLNFLDEYGWGGCLADDMGLGKTLQIITFLRKQSLDHPKAVNLVVVPTTLIFNWENEVKKFCPELKFHIHYGTEREKEEKLFKGKNIVITSYGTLLNDIEFFKNIKFNYVVLDESQAIKNPESQRSKAVKVLKARNRIIMTGTPVENNTIELFSQFNFLNPGFLGTLKSFKENYSDFLDTKGNPEKAQSLKRLISPFFLRRTKQEVATDLPEKTENILYCIMGEEQRKVYEAFKNEYKKKILGKIEENGVAASGIYILEGMMKLRQICNSPAILNTEEGYGNDSVKLKELLRHLKEKTSDHKVLVFSQFVEMLKLIRKELDKQNIAYEYLDGQSRQREKIVSRFKEDDCRVFLISLKAGGVGLNLTEADYVYLVDPWWNPAVEAQAIDRTHRIGQNKKVFAYKMICKDTIEEKILELQQKKKALADDLVSGESGMLKQLSREDIENLFS